MDIKERNQLVRFYPVFLNLKGKNCVVIGGGKVALRKVKMLLECGAVIKVIGTELCKELAELAENGKIIALRRKYQYGDLSGTYIAIAATDDAQINHKITREARRKSIPINIIDDPAGCDFIVPSSMHRGDITIAISTGGMSPALARKLRIKLETLIGDEFSILVNLIHEVRSKIKREGRKINNDSWQEAINLDLLLDLIRSGNTEKAKSTLWDNLKTKIEQN